MNVMITGAAGFMGGFLAEQCSAAGHSVLGFGHETPPKAWTSGAFERCDIRDRSRLLSLLSEFRPERIFHLAAQSYPTVSLTHPRETLDINVGGTVNLYECVREAVLMPTIVVACSSAEYGLVAAADLPTQETHPLRPLHPYGVSKVGQDLLALQYFSNYGIPSIRIRIFNTTGPSKLGDVCSDLTRRAVEIELGMRAPHLRVGNLHTRRALIDVRDMTRGLWMAAESGEPGEVYNVAGKEIYAVQEIVDRIRASVSVEFDLDQDPVLMRGCDEPVIAGDVTKFQTRTGWAPTVPLSQTIQDMIEWWRRALQGEFNVGPDMAAEPKTYLGATQ
jgi:GDP-4-dehydro-6-deoxy-D-mannose reductase